jgi:hypothetical protein
MRPGLFAFAAAAAFFGAALYINIVEQPARLTLDVRSMLREWTASDRRSFMMLSALSIISAILAHAEYARTGDMLWSIGGVVILMSLPYAYFVMVPVNIWLYATVPDAAGAPIRKLMRAWGLLEWGQTAIGLSACCVYAWALLYPA